MAIAWRSKSTDSFIDGKKKIPEEMVIHSSSRWRKLHVKIQESPFFSKKIAELIFSTYLLTPRSKVLLEKLPGSQLVKKFPAFYGT